MHCRLPHPTLDICQVWVRTCAQRVRVVRVRRTRTSATRITSLMHVIYCGEDAVPLQKETELYVKELQDMPVQLKIIHSW